MMPAINSKNGSAALLAKLLTEPSKADRSTENRDNISPRLVRAKYPAGRFWTCSNRRVRTSEISAAVSLASHRSYQTATIEVKDSGRRQHRENLDQRLEILFAERVVDQEFQAERHDDVEQRLHHDAEADEGQQFLVVLQERLDERIDCRQRAGGFLGGEDDEVRIVLFVFKLEPVLLLVVLVIRRGRPVGGEVGFRRELLIERRVSWIIRRREQLTF